MQDRDQVGAIIHGDVRLVIDRGKDVAVIGVIVLAFDGEHRDAVIAHQGCGHIVLGRQRIRRAQRDIGAAVAQTDGEVRGLGGDVQTSGDAHPS